MAETNLQRRDFLKTAGQVAAAAAICGAYAAAARSGSPGDRPNILVIMSDEHNPRVAGCYGSRRRTRRGSIRSPSGGSPSRAATRTRRCAFRPAVVHLGQVHLRVAHGTTTAGCRPTTSPRSPT